MDNVPKYSKASFLPIAGNRTNEKRSRVKEKNTNPPFSRPSGASCPWKIKQKYSNGVIGLHEEINDFFEKMRPTEQETDVRLKVVEHITRTVHSLWPLAKVEVFGSFRTGLYLPSSDIDMVILGEWSMLPLSTLSEALIQNGISRADINVIANAKVPIVRLLHSPSQIRVDISFNMTNGVKAARLIKNLMKEFPALPKLVLVLKQFLLHRGLNEVYNGGMSSYCLTLLIVSFLQGHHKPKTVPSSNLGTLLMEFFELYGLNLNYEKVSIHFQQGGCYQPRYQYGPGPILSVEDPLVEGNDVARGTFLMHQLKQAFQNSFHVLSKAVMDSAAEQRPVDSYLSLILKVSEEVVFRRQRLIDNYSKLMSSFSNSLMSFSSRDQAENSVTYESRTKNR